MGLSASGLALAFRAVVTAAASNLLPPDFAAADVTGLPGPTEDFHLQLMTTLAAAWVEIVSKARAAVAEGQFERLADGCVEAFNTPLREGVGGPFGADSGDEECLVGVDVADAGDCFLVE